MLAWCSEKLDVEDHYVAWRQSHDQPHHSYGADGPFSFCTYPFLLNPRAKSKLLHVEARIAMTKVGFLIHLNQIALSLARQGTKHAGMPVLPLGAIAVHAVGMISCSQPSSASSLEVAHQLLH